MSLRGSFGAGHFPHDVKILKLPGAKFHVLVCGLQKFGIGQLSLTFYGPVVSKVLEQSSAKL